MGRATVGAMTPLSANRKAIMANIRPERALSIIAMVTLASMEVMRPHINVGEREYTNG
jgi:hypothetical protein